MTSERPTVAECKLVVRQSDWTENQFELVMAANTLMENCETDPTITMDDGLACLDHRGVVAEIGARILYLLTGRDGLGWHGAGFNNLPYHVDKQNWLEYLATQSREVRGGKLAFVLGGHRDLGGLYLRNATQSE